MGIVGDGFSGRDGEFELLSQLVRSDFSGISILINLEHLRSRR